MQLAQRRKPQTTSSTHKLPGNLFAINFELISTKDERTKKSAKEFGLLSWPKNSGVQWKGTEWGALWGTLNEGYNV